MARKLLNSSTHTKFIPDQPLFEADQNTQIDGLGFERYAHVLAEFAQNTNGPFTIGINGSWGQGKTSLLRMIEKKLLSPAVKRRRLSPRRLLELYKSSSDQIVIPVRFNAWQFESEANPLIPLVLTINSALVHAKRGDVDNRKILRKLSRKLMSIAAGAVVSTEVSVDATKILSGTFKPLEFVNEYKDHIKPSAKIINLLEQRTSYYQAFELLNGLCAHLDGRVKIVIFIDDLDRCSPEKALQILEAIKLVLWQPGFIFFLAIDSEQLERYINNLDGKGDGTRGRRYFEKLLQVNFRIPQHDKDYASFLDQLFQQLRWNSRDNSIRPLLGAPLDYNPRRTIRLINAIQLIRQLLPDKIQFDIQVITVELLLSIRYENIYKLLCSGSASDNETLRKTVASWLPEDSETVLEKPRFGLKGDVLSDAWDVITGDQRYVTLLNSKPGRAWLNVAEDERRIVARLIRDQQVILDFVDVDPPSLEQADLDLQLIEDIENSDIEIFDQYENIENIEASLGEKMGALWDIAHRNMKKINNLHIAERALLTMVKIDEQNAAAYNRLGIVYAKKKEYAQAAECFIKANKFEKTPSSFHNLGLIYYETENYAKAATAFKEALKLEDGLAARHVALAKTFEKQGKEKQMFDELARAAELEPNKETYTLLRTAYEERGMNAEASIVAQKMVRLPEGRLRKPRAVKL